MMDWYLGHEFGDLVVPKSQQEYFDRLPSPDNWSPWETISGLGNSGWQNNFGDAGKVVNMPDEKPHQRMSFGRGNKDVNYQPEAEHSYGSSNLEGASEDSMRWNSARRGCPDTQFNNMMETDEMDDLFMSSLLNDDVRAASHSHNPLGLAPQSQCTEMPADRMLDFQSVSCDTDGIGSCKYFKTSPFSRSTGSDNGHSSAPNASYGNSSDHSNNQSVKALETMDMLLSEEAAGEDSSMEESVLLGLETVLSQLSDNTRICFRDSLYRLAKRSQPQVSVEVQDEGMSLDKPALPETSEAQTRSTTTMTGAESKTNTIDRAVANLMFHMVDGDDFDPIPADSPDFEDPGKASAALRACNYGMAQEETFLSPETTKSLADSEVPVFEHENPHHTQNQFAKTCY